MLYIVRSELSRLNEIGVKYIFILGLKKLLLLKSISQFTKKKNKETNKQQIKKEEKGNKPMLKVDLDLDDS